MTINTEMTPRARRMMVYCAVGFLAYLLILFMDMIQNIHLNRIDEQLKALDKQMNYEVEIASPPVSVSGLTENPAR